MEEIYLRSTKRIFFKYRRTTAVTRYSYVRDPRVQHASEQGGRSDWPPLYTDIIVIAARKCSWCLGCASLEGVDERFWEQVRWRGEVEDTASLCKGDGQLGDPGILGWAEVVAFGTCCGRIVSARSCPPKSDGCSAISKEISRWPTICNGLLSPRARLFPFIP